MAYPAGYWAELVRSSSSTALVESNTGTHIWLRTSDGEPLEQNHRSSSSGSWIVESDDTEEPDRINIRSAARQFQRFRKSGESYIPSNNGIRVSPITSIPWGGASTYRFFTQEGPPSFDDPTGDAIMGTVGTAIPAVTVPEANGFPKPTYAAVGSLPTGISFNIGTRVLSFDETKIEAGTGTITIRATNSQGIADWTVDYAFLQSNVAPSAAIATQAQTIDAGTSLQLAATDSDSDGSIAKRQWTGSGTFSDVTIQRPTWTAPSPARQTAYDLTYTVTDDDGATASATVRITVRAVVPIADAPTVTINPVDNGNEETSIKLSAVLAGSTYDTLAYAWKVSGGTLDDATLASPTWTRPEVDDDTDYTIDLTVTARGTGSKARSGTSDTASASQITTRVLNTLALLVSFQLTVANAFGGAFRGWVQWNNEGSGLTTDGAAPVYTGVSNQQRTAVALIQFGSGIRLAIEPLNTPETDMPERIVLKDDSPNQGLVVLTPQSGTHAQRRNTQRDYEVSSATGVTLTQLFTNGNIFTVELRGTPGVSETVLSVQTITALDQLIQPQIWPALYSRAIKATDKLNRPQLVEGPKPPIYPAGYWAELVRSLTADVLREATNGQSIWLRTSDGEPLEQEIFINNRWLPLSGDTDEPDYLSTAVSSNPYRFRKTDGDWIPSDNGIAFNTVPWAGKSTYRFFEAAVRLELQPIVALDKITKSKAYAFTGGLSQTIVALDKLNRPILHTSTVLNSQAIIAIDKLGHPHLTTHNLPPIIATDKLGQPVIWPAGYVQPIVALDQLPKPGLAIVSGPKVLTTHDILQQPELWRALYAQSIVARDRLNQPRFYREAAFSVWIDGQEYTAVFISDTEYNRAYLGEELISG